MPAPDQTTTPCERQHPTDLHADTWDSRTPTITPASTRAGRAWMMTGAHALRTALDDAHREYDQDRERDRIAAQIDRLTWRHPSEGRPSTSTRFLKKHIARLPLTTVTAVAVNGHLDYPDHHESVVYRLYGIEGTTFGELQRIYLLDVGYAAARLAIDRDIPELTLALTRQ